MADRGEATLEEVAVLFRVSRERIRQIERVALAKVKTAPGNLPEFLPPELPPRPPRRRASGPRSAE